MRINYYEPIQSSMNAIFITKLILFSFIRENEEMNLIKGQRYLFYYTDEHRATFRANFIKITHKDLYMTLIVDKRDNIRHTKWSIDMKIIKKIVSLSEIIDILPEDILLLIDMYL